MRRPSYWRDIHGCFLSYRMVPTMGTPNSRKVVHWSLEAGQENSGNLPEVYQAFTEGRQQLTKGRSWCPESKENTPGTQIVVVRLSTRENPPLLSRASLGLSSHAFLKGRSWISLKIFQVSDEVSLSKAATKPRSRSFEDSIVSSCPHTTCLY